jgi:hypothetical protein
MKTKAIVATLLVAAAASADARFAWPCPPKAVSPDEISHWVVISGNAWPNSPLFTGFQRPSSLAKQRSTVGSFQAIRVSRR